MGCPHSPCLVHKSSASLFILTSSYPHEILHNWWGNSVFVDYATGNWAEGLTAYMADHLIKEQQGQGARVPSRRPCRNTATTSRNNRDFPLSQFRFRHSAATEAVGYGKTLMGSTCCASKSATMHFAKPCRLLSGLPEQAYRRV